MNNIEKTKLMLEHDYPDVNISLKHAEDITEIIEKAENGDTEAFKNVVNYIKQNIKDTPSSVPRAGRIYTTLHMSNKRPSNWTEIF